VGEADALQVMKGYWFSVPKFKELLNEFYLFGVWVRLKQAN
jgi:hypothetical protein